MTVLKKTELLRVLKGGVSDETVLSANGKVCPHCGKQITGRASLEYRYANQGVVDWKGNPIQGAYTLSVFTLKNGKRFYRAYCDECRRHFWVHREINLINLYAHVLRRPLTYYYDFGNELIEKPDIAPAKEIRVVRPSNCPEQIVPITALQATDDSVKRLTNLVEVFG